MPVDILPRCPLCRSPLRAPPADVAARVERMLDAAEEAGVDLWKLEQCRRRLESNSANYHALVARAGRSTPQARRLWRSIESGMDALAMAFVRLETAAQREDRRERS